VDIDMPLRKIYRPTLDVVNFKNPIMTNHMSSSINMRILKDMEKWLEENDIVYRFKENMCSVTGVYFDNELDAVAFKLRWT